MTQLTAPPPTLNALFFATMDRFRDRPAAVRYRTDAGWTPISYRDFESRIHRVAGGLGSLGIGPGDRVALLSENRPEWALADFACLTIRAIDVPIYPTLTPKQIGYLLNDSGAKGIFVSTQGQLDKVREARAEAPALEWIVGFDRGLTGDDVRPLEWLESQNVLDSAVWRATAMEAKPEDLATIIYTSGTTGEPKGVMLTHGNIASNVAAGTSVLPVTETDSCLSLLPLSHIFERMTGHYSMFNSGVLINYAQSLETVPRDLAETKPTVVAAVPRLFEKIYAKALEVAVRGTPIRRGIFLWAKRVGEAWTDLTLAQQPIPPWLAIQRAVADLIVFRKIRARVGGRIRYFLSGGAPLPAGVARFFYAAGLPILEGYGLTETSPVISVNTMAHLRIGSVGRPIPGVEVAIAPDGEILTRGPNVMKGYYGKPDATAEVIDDQGWFHTGDIGELDGDGFLKITDRKKDLIATAGGKKIAPQPIEAMLRQNRFIGNAVMLGDRRRFPIALLVPNHEELESWARQSGIEWTNRAELLAKPEVIAHLEAEAKKHLRDLARFEVPKRFLLVAREFSIESGELTPKLSIRRRVVEANYQAEIDALYDRAGQPDE
ncbi:MAG: long-chain fatty acid--CoA ligase [Gemmatimonadetes bacterium]|nr:long-chain fatty acid--CoA ligase [Gemmatimonadota bacterium]